jgi:hypothetical protein
MKCENYNIKELNLKHCVSYGMCIHFASFTKYRPIPLVLSWRPHYRAAKDWVAGGTILLIVKGIVPGTALCLLPIKETDIYNGSSLKGCGRGET